MFSTTTSSFTNQLKVLVLYLYIIWNTNVVSSKCKAPIKLYEDLRCQPIITDFVSLCPIKYDCSNLQAERLINNRERKCYFDDVWYEIGTSIEIPAVCGVGVCTCTPRLNFECTKRDCPYTILPDVNRCFLSYGFDECCPETYHCITEWKNLSTCNVTSTIYLQGELFPSPIDECLLCVCNSDFDTNYGQNTCRSVPCRMSLLKSAELLRFCAPVYEDPTDCCPIDVRCPSESDIKAFEHERLQQDSNSCTYGPVKVPPGVTSTNTVEEYGSITVTECTCIIPPYMTCIRTHYT